MAPECLIVEDAQVQLACIPETSGELKLEGYRLPLDRIGTAPASRPRSTRRTTATWSSGCCTARTAARTRRSTTRARSACSKSSRRTSGLGSDGDRRRDTENDMPQVNVSFP